MISKLFIAFFLTITTVTAADIKVKIKTVRKTKILIEASEQHSLEIGDTLFLGEDCPLEVIKKGKKRAILEIELCETEKLLIKDKIVILKIRKKGQNDQLKSKNLKSFSQESSYTAKGFRAELFKSFVGSTAELTDPTSTLTIKATKFDHNFGLAFGHANIPIKKLGYLALFSYSTFSSEDVDSNSLTLEANGTYGINKNIYIYGGLNINKYSIKNVVIDYDMGLGLQAGAGYQFTKNFGVSASYFITNNSTTIVTTDIKIQISGASLRLNITF